MVTYRQIRIARVLTRMNIGGVAKHVCLLSQGLKDTFETLLIHGDLAKGEEEFKCDYKEKCRVPLVRNINPPADIKAYNITKQLLGNFQPDIVHSHMAKAGFIARLSASKLRPKPKILHTFHGHVLEGYFPKPVSYGFINLERYLAKKTDVLIAISEEIKEELLDLNIGRNEQYRIIPLGLDLTKFREINQRNNDLKRTLGINEQSFLIGIISRLEPIKDHKTLFNALAICENVHLCVIGDGTLNNELKQLCRDLLISDRVHFLGFRSDLDYIYSNLDAAVLSSLNEGTPVSLIEASASSLPVISTDVGGVKSVVKDKLTGLLCEKRNPQKLAKLIIELKENPKLRVKLGEEGRKHVMDKFSHERLLKDTRDLYTELLA
jgi:glycosyltransferase involved in cell wall biosynthesis